MIENLTSEPILLHQLKYLTDRQSVKNHSGRFSDSLYLIPQSGLLHSQDIIVPVVCGTV